ncbi:MAG: hypothetical protein QM784_03735 [Polyangiaceae bacterium]
MIRRITLLLLGCLGAAGCGQSEQAKRAEVASVTVAIDRLRDAPNPNKPEFLQYLASTPCSLEDVCALKKACADAYAEQVAALSAIAQLKSASDSGANAGGKLAAIQGQLERAREGAKACVEQEARLLDRYRAK